MLPSTWTDRVLAAGTGLAALALVVVALANWETFRAEQSVAGAAAPAAPRPAVAVSEPAAAPARPQVEQPNERVPRRPAPVAPVLAIRATGGASWLEVRAASETGEQLHYGTLAGGDTVTFEHLPVWVRVGAVDNLEIRLGRARLESLPASEGGVAEFVVSEKGVSPGG
jgi:hypothetical protein